MEEHYEKFELFRNVEHAKDYISKAQEAVETIISGNKVRLSSDEISQLGRGLRVIHDAEKQITRSLDVMKGWVFED